MEITSPTMEHTGTGTNLIDKDIVDFQVEDIRQLKSCRNEVAPISRLPPEILGKIFAFATSDLAGMIDSFDFPWSINLPKSINFSYVSKKWRSTALHTPDIWGTIPCVDAKWVKIMLERSKAVDLVLGASLSKFPLLVMKELLDNHSSRTRKIRFIQATESAIPELLQDVQLSSLCQLRSLHLAAAPSSSPDSRPRLPRKILGELHGLQHLYLRGFDFWPSAFPSMVSLTLIDIHRDYRPSLSTFISTLQSMPVLEQLRLEDSLPLALNIVKVDTPVVFRNLRDLRLSSEANTHEISNILPLFIIPQTTRINLSCEAVHSQISSSPLSDLASSLSTFFLNMNSGSRENVLYRFLQSYSSGVLLTAVKDKADGDFRLSVFSDDGSYLASQMLHEVFPSIPLLDVQTLSLYNRSCEAESLADTFGKLPKLRHVEASDGSINQFVESLTLEPNNRDPYEVSFPALQSICLRNVSFSCSVDDDTKRIDPDKLIDCFRQRCVRGSRLQKLILKECFHVNEEVVERFREVVEAEWDGVEASDLFELVKKRNLSAKREFPS